MVSSDVYISVKMLKGFMVFITIYSFHTTWKLVQNPLTIWLLSLTFSQGQR